MRVLLIAITLLLGGCASSQSASDVQEAFAVLQDAKVVKTAHTGYEGTLALEAQAFRQLLTISDASQQFERLLEQATLAGQVYALSGLYLTDRGQFEEVAASYRDEQREVEVLVGDIGGTTPVTAIIGFTSSVGTPGSIIDGSWPRALAGENEFP